MFLRYVLTNLTLTQKLGMHSQCHGLIQYNIIQLYCLCVEEFAFWLVIYIKTFNKINNKTSTTQ